MNQPRFLLALVDQFVRAERAVRRGEFAAGDYDPAMLMELAAASTELAAASTERRAMR